MITFNVTGFLTDFTSGQSQIVVDSGAKKLGEALGQLWQRHPAHGKTPDAQEIAAHIAGATLMTLDASHICAVERAADFNEAVIGFLELGARSKESEWC